MISKYKNSGAPKISSSGKRFDESYIKHGQMNPGPGSYTPDSGVNKTGQYFFNKYKNSGAPVFAKSRRNVELDVSETRKITPGPGTYRMQSEFGFYNPLL